MTGKAYERGRELHCIPFGGQRGGFYLSFLLPLCYF